MAIWIGEIILSIMMIMLALIFYGMSSDFPANINPVDVGAAAFPRLMAAITIILALALITRCILKRTEHNEIIVIDLSILSRKRQRSAGLQDKRSRSYSPILSY